MNDPMSDLPLRLDHLPDGFLEVPATRLHEILPGPTLIELAGRRQPALFVSVLLHGNEDVGLRAIQRVLGGYAATGLPRSIAIFVGNTTAAGAGVRRLDGQPDYNRVWPGSDLPHSAETVMMAKVTALMQSRGLFASIDLHNNTGLNPHYACVTRLDAHSLQLASLFSRTVVYFRTPKGVQSAAFAPFAPSVTCECGRAGDEAGVAHAADFVNACLHLESLPDHPVREGDVHLFHTVATLRLDPEASMSFDGTQADVAFEPDLDHFNFRELAPGTALARVDAPGRVRAADETGRDVTAELLGVADGRLTLARALMPAMLTRDSRVIRQDCLCYLMERLRVPDDPRGARPWS